MNGAPIRTWGLALVAIGVIVLLSWLAWRVWALPERGASGSDAARQQQEATVLEVARTAPNESSARGEASLRNPVAAADAEVVPEPWFVQLTGVVPAVPWTAPLRLVFAERLEVLAEVDVQGACRFMPPAMARSPAFQQLRLVANDPNYRLQRPHQRADTLQHFARDQFAVLPIAQLRGRVLGPDGTGLVARVQAFAWDADGPREQVLARTESQPDGTYVLLVPPDMELLLLAEATMAEPAPPLGASRQGPTALSFSAVEGERQGSGDARPDLSPASLRAHGQHGAPRTVPDMRLDATAMLTGRVLFADGRPLPFVAVTAQPRASQALWREQHHWSASEGLVRGAFAFADRDGAFALPLAPGVTFTVMATATDPLLLAGEPKAEGSAPGHVELRAPGELVTLRVVHEGQPEPNAWLELGDFSWRSDASGKSRVTIGPDPMRVRARAGVRSSPWADLSPGARSPVMTLQLQTPELALVQLHLRSEPVLLAAEFVCKPVAGGPAMTLAGERRRADQPFELRVPAGSYQLTVQLREGAAGGNYLVPLHLGIDVPASGLSTSHDATFGGRIELDVRDTNDLPLAGTFVLRDATGRDVTPMTVAFDDRREVRVGAAGVLQTWNVNRLANVLPPGEYSLAVDAGDRGGLQRVVTVRARETTRVALRL